MAQNDFYHVEEQYQKWNEDIPQSKKKHWLQPIRTSTKQGPKIKKRLETKPTTSR